MAEVATQDAVTHAKRAGKQVKDAAKNVAKAADIVVEETIIEPVVAVPNLFVSFLTSNRKSLITAGVGVGIGLAVPRAIKKLKERKQLRAESKTELKAVDYRGETAEAS